MNTSETPFFGVRPYHRKGVSLVFITYRVLCSKFGYFLVFQFCHKKDALYNATHFSTSGQSIKQKKKSCEILMSKLVKHLFACQKCACRGGGVVRI